MRLSRKQYNRLPERLQGCFYNGNPHPTIKTLELMKYLCRLITPKGGVVLDPFAGSGTTLMGAKIEGFDYIGVELMEEYIPIIGARLNAVYKGFDLKDAKVAKKKVVEDGEKTVERQGTDKFIQGSLFE